MYKLTISILLVTIVAEINCNTLADAPKAETNSFDSLIASQCKSKCLSMYPWWPSSTMKRSIANKRYSINQQQLPHHADNHIKWHKVMELCANNQICLQVIIINNNTENISSIKINQFRLLSRIKRYRNPLIHVDKNKSPFILLSLSL